MLVADMKSQHEYPVRICAYRITSEVRKSTGNMLTDHILYYVFTGSTSATSSDLLSVLNSVLVLLRKLQNLKYFSPPGRT